MSTLTAPVRVTVRRFGETSRRDLWWIQPLLVFLGLSTFLVYATWAAFQGEHYTFWPYPPSCTVGEPRSTYWGENSFPLILQNVHRYMLFLSLFVLIILAVDVWKALWWIDPATGS